MRFLPLRRQCLPDLPYIRQLVLARNYGLDQRRKPSFKPPPALGIEFF